MQHTQSAPKSGLVLYTNEASGNAYKVRLLIALLGLQVDEIQVDLSKGEQREPAFRSINPRGEIPVLLDGDKVLRDSSAILLYLAAKEGSSYWSKDPFEQASIADWLAFANSWIQYGVFTCRAVVAFGGSFNGIGAESSEQSLKEANARAKRSLEILEEHLGKHEWLALDRPTIGDIAVMPYVALSPMGNIDLSVYPSVQAWIARIRNLPGAISMPGLDDPDYYKKQRSA